MKILLTGATGMLGKKIYNILNNEQYTVLGIARNNQITNIAENVIMGDVTDIKFLNQITNSFKPNLIIHTAANINVNSCDVDKGYANLINNESGKMLAKLCRNAIFIYISTDAVYDGKAGNYDEFSLTNPLNYYGISKLNGEKSITSIIESVYILRLNIYGFHTPLRSSLFEWAINSLKAGKEITGFKNVFFNPLYTGQVAQVIKGVLSSQIPFGTYHVGSDTYFSKYDFLLKIAQRFDLDQKLIKGLCVENNSMGVVRAMNTTIKNNKIKSFLPNIDFSIETGIEQLYNDFASEFQYEKY